MMLLVSICNVKQCIRNYCWIPCSQQATGHRESKWLAVTLSFFEDPGADNVDMFGGKAASLAKLGSAGRIPPGFSLSVDEFKKWADSGSNEMSADVAAEINQAYAALERLCSVIRRAGSRTLVCC